MEVIVTGDRYIDKLVKFVDQQAGLLIEGIKVLKLNPAGLHYVQCRLETLHELESLLSDAPVDYLRAYVSDLGDFRALEQLRRILRLLPTLKVVSALPPPLRDPTPLTLLPFGRLKVLELRGCDLSTSAAKGLLELRHTLEKMICHNSTDALRHVFASRIVEIKDSPQWNRLSFVSCACNRLVLMDESLQLLPAVETLDLSRNKFAKIDNLRKCTKLKHLDLGFNHLRSVSFFSEIACHIVKLVLRNNGLATLHGIEKLKSLEALDVSYNIIANFSELECLAGLRSLKSLWLEGNPLCCALWYRAQVYSYFAHPENLKVDDEEISNKEYWKRRIIIARRQKQPASFGFYSPAKDDAEGDGSITRKKIKVSRLASIESDEESTYIGSDRETASCDDESQRMEDKPLPDDETEIVDLIKRVEQMKIERSIHWLRDFKEWMDHTSENATNNCDHNDFTSLVDRENYRKIKRSKRNIGECSAYVSDSILASGDDSSTNFLESDNSFAESVPNVQENWQCEQTGSAVIVNGTVPNWKMLDLKQEYQNFYSSGHNIGLHVKTKNSLPGTLRVRTENLVVGSQLGAAGMKEWQSSLADPQSPPHYQKDLLHRRQNLVEEILQLSADSYSMASSDSDTSGSEDDSSESQETMDRNLEANVSDVILDSYQSNNEADRLVSEKTSSISSVVNQDKTSTVFGLGVGVFPHGPEAAQFSIQNADWMEQRKIRRKPKRRVVSLLENGKLDANSTDGYNQPGKLDENVSNCQKLCIVGESCAPAYSEDRDDFILDFYNKNVENTEFLEPCKECVCCSCILDQSTLEEREVALLCGNDKLYLLLVDLSADGTGVVLSLLNYYSVEDIQEIIVGLGLQVVRVAMKGSEDFIFMTRSMDKSTKLLRTLKVLDSCHSADDCPLWSLESVQVEIIEKQIFSGSSIGIFQYSMVLFQRSGEEEYSWNSRSLLVIGSHVLLCIEDLFQFSSSLKDGSCSTYISLDLGCRISDVSEMIIEATESRCLTLALRCATSQLGPFNGSHESESRCLMHALRHASSLLCPYSGSHEHDAAKENQRSSAASQMWRLKWFCEESLAQFVALMKAIHLGTAATPLLVRYVS